MHTLQVWWSFTPQAGMPTRSVRQYDRIHNAPINSAAATHAQRSQPHARRANASGVRTRKVGTPVPGTTFSETRDRSARHEFLYSMILSIRPYSSISCAVSHLSRSQSSWILLTGWPVFSLYSL